MFAAVIAVVGTIVGAVVGSWLTARSAEQAARTEAVAAEQASERERYTARVEEWWTRFTWLVGERRELPDPISLGILNRLTGTAHDLHDGDLVSFAEQITAGIYRATVAGTAGRTPARQPDAPASGRATAAAVDAAAGADEPQLTRVVAARLLVEQARILGHGVDAQIAQDAAQPVPAPRIVS